MKGVHDETLPQFYISSGLSQNMGERFNYSNLVLYVLKDIQEIQKIRKSQKTGMKKVLPKKRVRKNHKGIDQKTQIHRSKIRKLKAVSSISC